MSVYIRKILHMLTPPLIATLIALMYLYNEEMTNVGNDIMLHVYPVWLLSKQIKELNWPFWGSWDPYRYCGFPYLTAYSPLFYYGAAFLSILFNVAASESVKWLVVLTFPLSTIAMYYCARQVLKNEFASMVSCLAYTLIPLRISSVTHVGNPTYSLALVFVPLVFLYMEKLLDGERGKFMNLALAALSLAIVILSHHGLGYALVFCLLIFLGIRFILTKKISIITLLAIPLAVAIGAFFIIPMTIYYLKYPFDYSLLSTPPIPPVQEALGMLFLPCGWAPVGLTAFTFGLVAPFFVKKDRKMLTYLIVAIIILVTYLLSLLVLGVLPIEVIGTRGIMLLSFLLPILMGFYVSSIKTVKFKYLVTTIIAGLMLLEATSCGVYHPPSVVRYMGAYEYVKSDPEQLATLRVWQVPRSHLVAALPIYTRRGTIDGVTFGPKEIDYFIFKSIANSGGQGLRGYGWGDLVNNADKTLRVLRILGVKYVIVDSHEPVYPLNVSRTIYQNLRSSKLVELVANFTDPRYSWSPPQIHIFKLKEWYPLIVAPKAFVMDESREEEWKRFYDIASREDFDPKVAIFLSKDNDLATIPFANWNGSWADKEHVNFKLEWLEQFPNGVGITVYVDRPSFLYVPITYYEPGLKVVVNGQRVEPLKALPNFIALYLSSKGTYTIFISRELSLVEMASLMVSFLTLPLLILLPIRNRSRNLGETNGRQRN